MVDKAQLTIGTIIHNSAHQTIPEGSLVDVNSVVHDTAQVGGKVTGLHRSRDVQVLHERDLRRGRHRDRYRRSPDAGNGDPRSVDTSQLAYGSYGFKATVAGNGNYVGATSACEPFRVVVFGKTMGFWGNQNGIAWIESHGGYAANAVNIGRGAVIDSKAESLKVLPNTLNACGKGSTIIFSDQTATKDCSLAKKVNMSSLNTFAGQTLALGYNIGLIQGYTGQTISGLGCTAYLTAGLTGSSTVQHAFAAAVSLINGSASGGTTTQTHGEMNKLLGCLNHEP